MSNSDDKIRLRITSPTFDDSDDFPSMTRSFGDGNKSHPAQSSSSFTLNGGSKHKLGSHRVDREDSPTDRYCLFQTE